MDMDSLSLTNLATYLDDEHITRLAKLGFDDAENVWQQLGVYMTDLHFTQATTTQTYPPEDAEDVCDNLSDESGVTSSDEDKTDDRESKTNALPSLTPWYPNLEAALCSTQDPTTDKQGSYAPDAPGIMESTRTVLEKLIAQEQVVNANGPW